MSQSVSSSSNGADKSKYNEIVEKLVIFQTSKTKFLFNFKNTMIYHGIINERIIIDPDFPEHYLLGARRASALIALLIHDLSNLLDNNKKTESDKWEFVTVGFSGFLRTTMEAMADLGFNMVTDFDQCPLLERQAQRDFALWMELARKAVGLSQNIPEFVRILKSSYIQGFGVVSVSSVASGGS